jgi:WD40 repeat protein
VSFVIQFNATGGGSSSTPLPPPSSTAPTSIRAVAFSPDGKQLAASNNQNAVWIWDAATGRLLSGWTGTTENFVQIGHTFFILLAAWLGGHLSRFLFGRNEAGAHASLEPVAVIAQNDGA